MVLSVKAALRKLGLEVSRSRNQYGDLPPEDLEIATRVEPFTMSGTPRILATIHSVRYLVQYRIPGEIVECGVWRGGSMMAAALALMSLGDTSRHLYLYDTFEGMSPPTSEDVDFAGRPAAQQLSQERHGQGIWCYSSLDEVRANLASTGYPLDRVHFVQGRVEDTIPQSLPPSRSLALLRLDTDWYGSTRHELIHLFPLLSRGGVLIIDDYGYWQGARKATDEYFAGRENPILLHRIDRSARAGVKI